MTHNDVLLLALAVLAALGIYLFAYTAYNAGYKKGYELGRAAGRLLGREDA